VKMPSKKGGMGEDKHTVARKEYRVLTSKMSCV